MSVFNIIYDPNGADGCQMMEITTIECGKATPFRKNIYSKKGYQFIGWKALRMSDKKTCYTDFMGQERRYYIEDTQPEGWSLFLYPDEFKVSALSKKHNDAIILSAQWESVLIEPAQRRDFVPMRFGILSINMHSRDLNFACPVHSWAFQQFLNKNGIDNTIIDYIASYDYDYDIKHPIHSLQKQYEALAGKENRSAAENAQLEKLQEKCRVFELNYDLHERRYNKFKEFTDKYYKKTTQTYTSDLLDTETLDFDGYICASDVIWRTVKKWGIERAYMLGSCCMDNKHKIAYAASRNSDLTDAEQAVFFKYLNDFDHIAVREECLEEYICSHSNLQCTCVLDPVMLLEQEDYEKIAVVPPYHGYLLLYYVIKSAEDIIEQAVLYAKQHHLKIIELNDRPYSSLEKMGAVDVEYEWFYDVGPDEWLGFFLNAGCIFTNSFHACCFSILFQKEFFAGQRNGTKVQNILKQFQLEDRQLDSLTGTILKQSEPIDYKKVGEILIEKRAHSADYILNAVQQVQCTKRPKYDYTKQRSYLKYPLYYQYKVGVSDTHRNSLLEEKTERQIVINNGKQTFIKTSGAYEAVHGWKIRIRIDNIWFWYLEDGKFCQVESYSSKSNASIKIFEFGEKIPYLPFSMIREVIAEEVLSDMQE